MLCNNKRLAFALAFCLAATLHIFGDAAPYGPYERRVDVCRHLANGYEALRSTPFEPDSNSSFFNSNTLVPRTGNENYNIALTPQYNLNFNVDPGMPPAESYASNAANAVNAVNAINALPFQSGAANFADDLYTRMVNLKVVVCSEAKWPRLILPGQTMRDLDQFAPGNAAVIDKHSYRRVSTIVSGGLTALAMCFGGLIFFRSRANVGVKVSVVGCVSILFVLVSVLTWASEPPPTAPGDNLDGRLNKERFINRLRTDNIVNGEVELLISDEVYDIILIVPTRLSKPEPVVPRPRPVIIGNRTSNNMGNALPSKK